jgi:hypothetical protein
VVRLHAHAQKFPSHHEDPARQSRNQISEYLPQRRKDAKG